LETSILKNNTIFYQFPLEIFSTLEYIGIDAEGNIHIIISKKNKKVMESIVKILKPLEGREFYIRFGEGRWEKE